MLSRSTLLVMLLAATVACDKVPLGAPSGSAITVSASAQTLAVGESAEISAFVSESSGTPVQNGTTVRFTTTLGAVDPVEALTRNGVAVTTLTAGNLSGVAQVRATSGGGTGGTGTTATNVVEIPIGAAAVDTISVTANPSIVSANGGTVDVIANVFATGGRPLSGVAVAFSANRGTLSSTTAITDAAGEARVKLTTNSDTTINASAGGKTSTTAANVTAQPGPAVTLTCTVGAAANCATANVGEAVTFTAERGATTSNIRSSVLDFGDGGSVDVGALSGSVVVAHRYDTAGTYTARLTATDVNGETATATQIVRVEAATGVTLALTPAGLTVTAEASASGGTVLRYEWNFGAGATPSSFQTTTASTSATYATNGVKTVSVTVRFTDGRTTSTSGQVTLP
jgi:PKD repeat protein